MQDVERQELWFTAGWGGMQNGVATLEDKNTWFSNYFVIFGKSLKCSLKSFFFLNQ